MIFVSVIPAQAGIHSHQSPQRKWHGLDPRLRGDDNGESRR